MTTELTSKPLTVYDGVAGRILKLLGTGVTQRQAALAIGVDESYVSQLCAEEDFQLQVGAIIKKSVETAIAIDTNYNEIEEALSKKLKEMVPWMVSTDQVLRVLKFVNESKKKTQQGIPQTPEAANGNITSVKLELPVIVKNTFVITPNKEVVGVGEQNLVTLNSASMDQLAKKFLDNRQTKQLSEKVVIDNGTSNSKDPWDPSKL